MGVSLNCHDVNCAGSRRRSGKSSLSQHSVSQQTKVWVLSSGEGCLLAPKYSGFQS